MVTTRQTYMAALNQYENNVNRRDCNLGRGRMMSQTRPCRGSETAYYYKTSGMKYYHSSDSKICI